MLLDNFMNVALLLLPSIYQYYTYVFDKHIVIENVLLLIRLTTHLERQNTRIYNVVIDISICDIVNTENKVNTYNNCQIYSTNIIG